MTPRAYQQYIEQARKKREGEERTSEIMFAQLTAMVANTGFRVWWDGYQDIEKFMPSEWRKKKRRRRVERPGDAADQLRAFFEKRLAAQKSA